MAHFRQYQEFKVWVTEAWNICIWQESISCSLEPSRNRGVAKRQARSEGKQLRHHCLVSSEVGMGRAPGTTWERYSGNPEM